MPTSKAQSRASLVPYLFPPRCWNNISTQHFILFSFSKTTLTVAKYYSLKFHLGATFLHIPAYKAATIDYNILSMFSCSHFHRHILQYPSNDSKHILKSFSLKSHQFAFLPFFQFTLSEYTYHLQNAARRYLSIAMPWNYYYYKEYCQNHNNNSWSQIPHAISQKTEMCNTVTISFL